MSDKSSVGSLQSRVFGLEPNHNPSFLYFRNLSVPTKQTGVCALSAGHQQTGPLRDISSVFLPRSYYIQQKLPKAFLPQGRGGARESIFSGRISFLSSLRPVCRTPADRPAPLREMISLLETAVLTCTRQSSVDALVAIPLNLQIPRYYDLRWLLALGI